MVWPQTIGGVVASTIDFDIQKSATSIFTSPTTLASPTIANFSPTEYTATDPSVGTAVFYRVVAYTSRSPDVLKAISSAFQPVDHAAGDRCFLCCMHANSHMMCTSSCILNMQELMSMCRNIKDSGQTKVKPDHCC